MVDEGLSPLNVSIHATDPDVRSALLRNRRGATSLRWLRALLDHGIEVHGQIVVCPGLNDGAVLDDTLCGVLDQYPELQSVCVVPLGVSRFNPEARMRPHTPDEAAAVLDVVHDWQETFLTVLGRRLVHAADEYYLLADRPFPPAEHYEDFAMHEDGIGMARTFELEFTGAVDTPTGPKAGFFAWVDGAPAEGYRAHKAAPVLDVGPGAATTPGAPASRRRSAPTTILTGPYGAQVLRPLLDAEGFGEVRVRGGREPLLRRQRRRRRAAGGRGPRPGAGRRAARAATCCPTCACRAGASSTAPPPTTCPARSRSSPPTAWRCGRCSPRELGRLEPHRRRRPAHASPSSVVPTWASRRC